MALPLEVNAAAGQVGTSYTLTLTKGRDDRIRVNGAPNRTATVNVVGGSSLRHATVDNAGAFGAYADVAAGSSFTVSSADGAREAVMVGAGDSTTVRVVIS
jgi:hypothetical protein